MKKLILGIFTLSLIINLGGCGDTVENKEKTTTKKVIVKKQIEPEFDGVYLRTQNNSLVELTDNNILNLNIKGASDGDTYYQYYIHTKALPVEGNPTAHHYLTRKHCIFLDDFIQSKIYKIKQQNFSMFIVKGRKYEFERFVKLGLKMSYPKDTETHFRSIKGSQNWTCTTDYIKVRTAEVQNKNIIKVKPPKLEKGLYLIDFVWAKILIKII